MVVCLHSSITHYITKTLTFIKALFGSVLKQKMSFSPLFDLRTKFGGCDKLDVNFMQMNSLTGYFGHCW